MNNVKRIVCLAYSRKPPSGKCVAGKEVLGQKFGGWFRPISARPTAEISEEESRFQDGKEPRLLDIIDIPVKRPMPYLHQSENIVIDADHSWQKIGQLPWPSLQILLDEPPSLWQNGDSSKYGLNNRIREDIAAKFNSSLFLIKPEKATIKVQTEGTSKRRIRADFRYQNENYRLSVTDPVAEQAFLAKANGEYPLHEVCFCVSLGQKFDDGSCYKLVAAVIGKQPL